MTMKKRLIAGAVAFGVATASLGVAAGVSQAESYRGGGYDYDRQDAPNTRRESCESGWTGGKNERPQRRAGKGPGKGACWYYNGNS